MALRKLRRGLQPGKKKNSSLLSKLVNEIVRVGSLKKNKIVLKIPLGKPIGKVYYSVESELDPMTFKKKKEALAFQKLLLVSTSELKSDIVRREVTDKGYEVTYGDRK